ncbi:MAG: anaerobic ribonucleoside-triphosphate reductase [Candidatus Paceibacteria bacterium]
MSDQDQDVQEVHDDGGNSLNSNNEGGEQDDSEVTQQDRTKCEVWTRVMGYFRPMSEYNPGKKSEHFSRERFEECRSANTRFISEFSGEEELQAA